MPAGELRHARDFLQVRPPILAAFSASHHHRLGKAEAVPARGALKSAGELRDKIAIPEQYPIQGLASRDQFGAVFCEDDTVYQGVDCGIFDAGKVARTGPVRRLRPEKVALLVARRQRLSPYRGGDIEVETAQTILILYTIDGANIHGHAEPLQIWLVKKQAPLVTLLRGQEFNTDRLPCGIEQLAVANLESGLFQKPSCFAQIVASRVRIAADWIFVRRCEDLGRHLVAYRFEDLQFLTLGKSRRGEFGDAVKIAAVAMVPSVRELPVRLLPIIGIIECAADSDIGK